MSCKFVAGLVGLAVASAIVTFLVCAGTEVKAELAPMVANPSSSGGCAQEPWPYGCQWRTQRVKRIVVRTRPEANSDSVLR